MHELDHQRDDALKGFGQAHIANHVAADFLQEAELPLGTLELRFQFSCAGHRLYYVRSGADQ